MTQFEIFAKLIDTISQLLVPIVMTLIGFMVSKRMKGIEQAQWTNQKLIEKRITVYDSIAPKLNQIFCYYLYVGDWKETTPPEVIALKRACDKTFHTYKFIFDDGISRAYDEFMHGTFQMFNEAGADARMRTKIVSADGDRRIHAAAWQDGWERYFTEANTSPKEEVRAAYNALMHGLAQSIKQGVRQA